MLKGQEILLFFSCKYYGDWDLIFQAIKNKECFDEEQLKKYKEELKATYITIIDEDYPNSLKNCYKPPFVLFYYGDISLLHTSPKLTVVGSRDCSSYGGESARKICEDLARNNVILISGLARGIDTIAHKSALDSGGKTIAVLGSGIDLCYPKQNIALYEQLKKNHLIISEYPNETLAKKENFPKRNRILAALGDALFVPEFKFNSGTSITISCALNNGKTIFCIPSSINAKNDNNKLIKEGAILVESCEDILNEM